jgi:NAD-dependent deacetylase
MSEEAPVSERLDDPRPDDALQTAARVLARSAKLAVFTGAGISKESGIPTFREPETGLWAQYDPMQLATPEAYRKDPAFVWSWYEHRFGVAADAEPNPGHLAIAELESLLPRVVIITQNIDGLHQRAGSSQVIELHGSMHSFRCIDGRHRGYCWEDFADQEEKPPRCPECGDFLRPEVVWFGEGLPPDALNAAQRLSAGCDVMLIVGTSGVVYPAAAMPMIAKEAGATVIDVNPERDALAQTCDLFLRGPGGEVLPELVLAVRSHLEA